MLFTEQCERESIQTIHTHHATIAKGNETKCSTVNHQHLQQAMWGYQAKSCESNACVKHSSLEIRSRLKK